MKEFQAVFQMSKMIVFEVRYYTLNTNARPYYATQAAKFVQNKRDYARCGQAQPDLLPDFPVAMNFFQKWDHCHLRDLTAEEYAEMTSDLDELKNAYNYIYEELDESRKPYNPRFGLYRLAEFSKQTPKHKAI